MKKIRKDKAFTLIELLAVIIILAIVALIATPIILDVIEDTRISAGKSESNMILSGINNYCASIEMKKQLGTLDSEDVDCSGKTSFSEAEISKMVNLGNATVDKNTYNGNKLTELVIISNNHKFTLCPSGTFVMDDEKCDEESVGIITTGPIKDVVLSNFPYLETNGNGCVTSDNNNYSYMGGCYIKGTPDNNYIWYSGFLWRIMGINADQTVRLITDEILTTIPWGEYNANKNWNESYAKDWLNSYFYSKLRGNNIIKKTTWCSEITTNNSSVRTECSTDSLTVPSYVGLLTLDEYNLSGGFNSYLNIGQIQLFMTKYDSFSTIWGASYDGRIGPGSSSISTGLRAIINVNSEVIIAEGNGTLEEIWSSEIGPYITNEDKNLEVTKKLNEKSTSGEYVMFVGRKYRVVDKDSDGNTKLILDGYYEENGSIFSMKYNLTNTNEFLTTTGIGQKLNMDVLNWITNNNDIEKMKVVENYTWYQNNFNLGYDYKLSLKETNADRSIQSTVGLIRVGEMLSSQSSSILTKGYTEISNYINSEVYWTMTTLNKSDSWYITIHGQSENASVFLGATLRPVIVIKNNVEIVSGNGTWSNPYNI